MFKVLFVVYFMRSVTPYRMIWAAGMGNFLPRRLSYL